VGAAIVAGSGTAAAPKLALFVLRAPTRNNVDAAAAGIRFKLLGGKYEPTHHVEINTPPFR